ncbi:putative Zn-dependent peptidase [Xanthobacter agilis]|uniref:Zn-dependent peptidase n=2 Tax=Xanthobacter agilis TaxID=47492 RepID=A0ABU0LG13_XANAG|nr:pitrilysin family protein [Xanthobacter agilis]MDQ0506038.1 putative Zn-dependent peptidase [Xanthobacter agilis]
MMGVEISTLDNGITVVTDSMTHLGTASLGIWVGTGARDENEDEHGISHLLEHMAFKGTRRRSARRIAEEIEQVGGDINAATSVEQTSYNVRVLGEDVPLGLDILADILTEPAFAADELAREKGVIVQEIGAVMDTPDDLVFDLFQEQAFPGQAVGRSILGTPETVRGFNRDQLGAYLSRTYRGPRMVVAAAGAVDHQQVVAEAAARLKSVGGAAKPELPKAAYTGGIQLAPRELEQVHVLIGLEGCSYHHGDYHALQVLTNVLGGGMSSRLFQDVREERGLCYSIYSFHWSYADTGLFGIYAGTDTGDVGELSEAVIDQLFAAGETITEVEVARAKAQMKVGLLAALESSGARADQLARQILGFGRVIPVDEIVAKVDAVDVAMVRQAAQTLVARGRPTLTALGPESGLAPAARAVERLRG